MEILNEDQALEKMVEIDQLPPPECHIEADDLIVEFLRSQGYEKLAEAYDNIYKWFE